MTVPTPAAGARQGDDARSPCARPDPPFAPSGGASSGCAAGLWRCVALIAALVLPPVVSARRDRRRGRRRVGRISSRTCCRRALRDTALLSVGVALRRPASSASLRMARHRAPLSRPRRFLAWLLPLPLAVPTYITAYVYVEIFDAAGRCRSGLAQPCPRIAGRLLVPRDPLALRLRPVMSLRALPLCLHRRAAMFLTQSASMIEVARTLGARGRSSCSAPSRCRSRGRPSRSALALALLEALNDIGASEYLGVRTLTVVGLHDLAQPRQPCRARRRSPP